MMSQQILLIDGYNVINRLPELKACLDKGLENTRNRLAFLISRWKHRHPAVECVIIFDGDTRFMEGRYQCLAGIQCIFSQTAHSGDDEIIRLVRKYQRGASEIMVVSDDNYVRNNCRALGASVQPASYILGVRMQIPSCRTEAQNDGKVIDKKTAAEIDKELRKRFGI